MRHPTTTTRPAILRSVIASLLMSQNAERFGEIGVLGEPLRGKRDSTDSGAGTHTVDDFPQRPPEKEEHAACGQSRSARDWTKCSNPVAMSSAFPAFVNTPSSVTQLPDVLNSSTRCTRYENDTSRSSGAGRCRDGAVRQYAPACPRLVARPSRRGLLPSPDRPNDGAALGAVQRELEQLTASRAAAASPFRGGRSTSAPIGRRRSFRSCRACLPKRPD